MKKIPMSKKTARNLDYFFWSVWMIILVFVDWRLAVAFVVFDTMRAFEIIQKEIELNERENAIIAALAEIIAEMKKAKDGTK